MEINGSRAKLKHFVWLAVQLDIVPNPVLTTGTESNINERREGKGLTALPPLDPLFGRESTGPL